MMDGQVIGMDRQVGGGGAHDNRKDRCGVGGEYECCCR